MTPLLTVNDLSIGFGANPPAVRGVSFAVNPGETLALVGESGSGKTVTCRTILRILPRSARFLSGQIALNLPDRQIDLTALGERAMRRVRGNLVSMIFQEPMRSLSPLHRIGNQVSEALCLHRSDGQRTPRRTARERVLETFARVGFPDPERAYQAYPFELSGGMRQRAMIAMAMVTRPALLIADEPTTALDVTTQAQVLGLMKDLQSETGMAMIIVTHDLGVVANMAERVVVMHKGRVMESGPARDVLGTPGHAYTRQLFDAAPAIPAQTQAALPPAKTDPILELKSVSKTYAVRGRNGWAPRTIVQACRGIDLSVQRGKTLAIVGESGSGKTTAARIALGAEVPDEGGEVLFHGPGGAAPLPVHLLDGPARAAFRRQAQMVFQDPYSSLSPRMRIIDALCEPLDIHGIGTPAERRDKAAEMLAQVGLGRDMMYRYPHAFSGGQRQRLSVARALMLNPSLLVCDEPTSALDVSVQDQILTLLEDIRDRMTLSYLFISHDLAVVARIADEVAVMRQGLVVEQATPDTLFHAPRHPYTRALIAAQPTPDISRPIDLGVVAQGAGSPQAWPEEFRFDAAGAPALTQVGDGHLVRAHV
ncbi:MAG: ABC transporter ATP-binding protein [Pseudooceanicola sp.]|jgi:peptide/nickel transport system ATP-binding protein|nr:ABC transporter ATP-binding protein [Pseudooceanicola sp.]